MFYLCNELVIMISIYSFLPLLIFFVVQYEKAKEKHVELKLKNLFSCTNITVLNYFTIMRQDLFLNI